MKPTKQIRQWYSYIGKKGGAAATPKKKEASQSNGRKGGPPLGNQNWKGKNKDQNGGGE